MNVPETERTTRALNQFDDLIQAVNEFSTARGKAIRTCQMPTGSMRFKVGPGVSRGVLLRSETYVELGSATVASSCFVLATGDTSRLVDGRVRLMGPDIHEARRGSTLPFGLVLIAGGYELDAYDYEKLLECLYVSDWIEGYMVRSRPGSIWGRVSRDAIRRGFDFAFLAAALTTIVRKRVPNVVAVEIFFVTSSETDVHLLDTIGEHCRGIAHELHRKIWSAKGIDIDCRYEGGCGACGDKQTCDEVRKITHLRKLMKRDSREDRDEPTSGDPEMPEGQAARVVKDSYPEVV